MQTIPQTANVLFRVKGSNPLLQTFGGVTTGAKLVVHELVTSATPETFYNKTINATNNDIIISASQLVDGSNLAHLSGVETLTQKTITDASSNVIARALWTSAGSNSVSTYASIAPLPGQVLTATSSTTAIWVTPGSSGGGRKTYMLFSGLATAPSSDWNSLSYFSWINSRYILYVNGTLVYAVRIYGTNLDVRLYDTTNAVVLGSDLNISINGVRSLLVSNPTTDAVIAFQIRKSTSGGLDPEISGVSLEYD